MQRRNFLALLGNAGWVLPALASAAPGGAARTLQDLLPEKGPLTLLNDRPINAETPAHLLDDATTPTNRLFVRNNGYPPDLASLQHELADWRFEVGGEGCVSARSFTLSEIKSLFKTYSYNLQLECGGNGRAEFRPRASGNQWSTGAIGCPRWTGVRLKDVLDYCGIRNEAQYVAYRGADRHLSGKLDSEVISRGVPLHKALEDESLLAFELNGEPIPLMHGGPLRMVCGGWPGSVSGKWITEILLRDRVHDGAKMGGKSYRMPCESVAPGTSVADAEMCIIESMPVKSLITFPRSGVNVEVGSRQMIRGQAWAGDLQVSSMSVSLDFGATWQAAELAAPANRLAWQQWRCEIQLPKSGYYEFWARATDELGRSQPMLVPGWNPKGYLNNASHRIAIHGV